MNRGTLQLFLKNKLFRSYNYLNINGSPIFLVTRKKMNIYRENDNPQIKKFEFVIHLLYRKFHVNILILTHSVSLFVNVCVFYNYLYV